MGIYLKRPFDEDKERPGISPSLSLKIPSLTGQTNKDEIDAWRDRTNNRTGSTSNNGGTSTGTSTGTTTLSPLQQAAQNKADAEAAVKSHGKFSYTYQDQLDDVMNQILNREKSSYDLNGDALYRQYADKFAQQGQMAMMDTMGQAQAMTGGYANSYAQTVGQQAYQAQLQKLNDIVPDLYQMALDRYDAEGNELLNKYGLLTDDYNRAYGEHLDDYNKLLTERDYANNEYANAVGNSSPDGVTDIGEIQKWFDAVLDADTEEEAKLIIDKLAEIDPNLALKLNGILTEPEDTLSEEDTATHLERMKELGSWDAATDYVNKLNLTDDEKAELLSQFDTPQNLTERTWVVDEENGGYGGSNLLGINRNAQIKDAYGNSMSLAEYRQKLMREEGMTLAEANKYIKEMQDDMGIKQGLQGFFDDIGGAIELIKNTNRIKRGR